MWTPPYWSANDWAASYWQSAASAASGDIIGAGGIATAEAFGQPLVEAVGGAQEIICIGIESAEAFGTPTVEAVPVYAAAINRNPGRAIRVPLKHQIQGAGGIASGEAFGQPTITLGKVPGRVRKAREEEFFLMAA